MSHEFRSSLVEEFYNSCHDPKTGRFCGGTYSKGKRFLKGARDRKTQPHADGSTPLRGTFKVSGNKRKDAIKITRLDRGSPERAAAAAAFNKAYG